MIEYKWVTRANVYLRETLVGTLEKQSPTQFLFQYLPEYLASNNPLPIACVFPLRQAPYLSPVLHSFFDNLILEGWLLSYTEKALHIDRKNRFALLMACGRSSVGAVSIHPLESNGQEFPPSDQSQPTRENALHLEPIDFPIHGRICISCLLPLPEGRTFHARCATDLFGTTRRLKIEIDSEQPLETFSRTVFGGSISGAQRKGLFFLNTSQGVFQASSLNSSYVLKPDGDYPELPANEHLTMSIAREIGFKVPPSCLIQIPSLGFVYLVRRFDRLGKTPRRMEDMGQLLGEVSEDKYESSCEKVAQAIRRYSTAPVLDLNDFFKRLLFCFITANADMHLKNWSLLEGESLNGDLHLSPCYDFLNTRLVIPREPIDIGLPLLGKSRNLQRSYFIRFAAESLQLRKPFVDKVFADLKRWVEIMEALIPRSFLSEPLKKRYLELVRERFEILTS